jgi:CRISPR-associated protein Cas2
LRHAPWAIGHDERSEPIRRTRYLVSYDICEPKRLRKVAKVLEGFGVRLQYSVFECPLDEMRFAQAKATLHAVINHDEDQVLFVSLGPAAGDAELVIEAMGLPYRVRTRVTII